MNKHFRTFYMDYRSHGLTLIEVVAALVVLSTLLSSLMMANSAHRNQYQLATQKQQALELLDQWLRQFKDSPASIPINQSGYLDVNQQWEWRTSVDQPLELRQHNLSILTLQVYRSELAKESQDTFHHRSSTSDIYNTKVSNQPMTTLHLAIPNPDPDPGTNPNPDPGTKLGHSLMPAPDPTSSSTN